MSLIDGEQFANGDDEDIDHEADQPLGEPQPVEEEESDVDNG